MNYDLAHHLFTYNSKTGELLWKNRPREDFQTKRGWKIFQGRFAGKPAGSQDTDGHIQIGYSTREGQRVCMFAHRIIWLMHYGYLPENDIDHINQNPADNRLENLRHTSREQNARNQKERGLSLPMGVYKHRNRFVARIKVNYKSVYLGCFGCVTAAYLTRLKAQKKYNFHPNHGKTRVK